MNVLVTGGTGLVGSKVCQALQAKGHKITVLTRSPDKARKECDFHATFVSNSDLSTDLLKSLDAVVHLAGEPLVEGRWTEEKKKRIMKSRGQFTTELTKRFVDAGAKLKVFVSASAMGIYGDRGDEVLTESSEAGEGFLANVCKAWEKPVNEIGPQMSDRQVILRISLVLSGDGGFLGEVLPIFKAGLGGALGDGQQWMSWIHINDLVKFVTQAVEQDKWNGPVNMASPNPVRNKELTKKLNKVLGRFTFLPVPEFFLKVVFGEKADMLLASTRLNPHELKEGGFDYEYLELQSALKTCMNCPR